MRKSQPLLLVLALFLLVPASITRAQTITSQKGLTTAIFSTPHGNVKVYLPDDIRPGDQISGTIFTEPKGLNVSQLKKNQSELINYKVSIEGSIISVGEQQSWSYAVKNGNLNSIPMELLNSAGKKKHSLIIPLSKVDDNQSIKLRCIAPSHALTDAPCRITGNFDGNASNTNVTLNTRQIQVLAESPRQCIIKLPEHPAGTQTLDIADDINKPVNSCTVKINMVNLVVSAGNLNLRKGEKTFVKVQISGLNSLTDTAALTLTNISTNIVKLLPANNQFFSFFPDDSTGNVWSKVFDVQSLQSGGFAVVANLNLPGDEELTSSPLFNINFLKNESGYPGSYGNKENQPCEPESATIKWRWHKTFACEIIERKVLPCGQTKEGNDIYEKIKELLEELELDKATDIGEKMAKAFSVSKSFSYSIHVIRKWVDYDIEYKCVNSRWQSTGGVYVKHGTDDLGWHSVDHLSTKCWLTFNTPADEQEFEAALETALRKACK